MGLGNLEALIVLEEFAKCSAAVAFPVFESSVGPSAPSSDSPMRACAGAWCQSLCGELLVAVSMSEPQAGSALTDLTTRAQTKGDRVISPVRSDGVPAEGTPTATSSTAA